MTELARIRSRFTPWLLLSLAIFGVFVWIDLQVMGTLSLKVHRPGDGWWFLRLPFVVLFMLRSTTVLFVIGALAAAPALLVHLRVPKAPPIIAWIALAAWGYLVAWQWAFDWPLLAPLITSLEVPNSPI